MSVDQEIIARLKAIETEYRVRIIYACESGSRAWGFASTDSDYDVRFIYAHPVEHYLSIQVGRDVIEAIDHVPLDINGWDIRKALRLFRKSNPPLMEWLGAPIRYLEPYSIAEKLRGLAPVYYSPQASGYHYLHMAQGNYREHLRGEQVWLKKYFYVLRPILAINWIERGFGVVPTEFAVLVGRLITSPPLLQAIDSLLEAKKNGAELDMGPRIAPISNFIESELSRLKGSTFVQTSQSPPLEPLEKVFKETLREVWGNWSL